MKRLVALMICAVSLGAAAQFRLPYNPDENGDGFIGVADLQSFLTNYGNEFVVENLSLVNETALYYLGVKSRYQCPQEVQNLTGNWSVLDLKHLMQNFDVIANMAFEEAPSTPTYFLRDSDNFQEWGYLALNGTNYGPDWSEGWFYLGVGTTTLTSSSANSYVGPLAGSTHCFCYLEENPKVEYCFCNGPLETFLECTEEKTSLGWYPSGDISPESTAGHFVQAFWRWAE